LNQRETHPELDDRFEVKVGEVKKKNYQVLCPNCEATIIKENGLKMMLRATKDAAFQNFLGNYVIGAIGKIIEKLEAENG
ncbi:hypothetical protein, partial [Faecalibacterium duncaniae]|uniref:hypothetical protein n=1 Tax=Faecalibacterium duncaniae (strain DSM 17677 / JCM 31915 / A2-165) TaxID=411483 RepID=UPI00293F8E87